MRAGFSVNLHGIGHLTSIGARVQIPKCPDSPGETAAKLPHVLTPIWVVIGAVVSSTLLARIVTLVMYKVLAPAV